MGKYVALFIGSVSAQEKAERAPDLDGAAMASAMEAWGKWMADHASAIVEHGSPLGRTLRVSPDGVARHENRIVAYIIVEADSHEAAACMFENHPHFAMMPGDSIEVMECLSVPEAPDL